MSSYIAGPVIAAGTIVLKGFKAAGRALLNIYDDSAAMQAPPQLPTCDEIYWEPELNRGRKEGWNRDSHGTFLNRDFG